MCMRGSNIPHIISAVYPEMGTQDPSYYTERVILAPTTATVRRINNIAISWRGGQVLQGRLCDWK